MTAITPGNTKIIPMRSTSSNTSIASMTDEMLKEIRTNPTIYSDDANKLTIFLRDTCTASVKNSKTHGPEKTLPAVYKEMGAYLKKKEQTEPTVIKLQKALSQVHRLTFQLTYVKTDQTSTPIPNQGFGFQPSSIITAAKSKISSTRIKEGRVSPSDLETISNPTALAEPVVQRRVLKGILRGKIVAEGPGAKLINLMKATVTPMLSANDQADILQVKEGHDHALGVLLREHPECIRFFTDSASQQYIARAIRSVDFGHTPAVLQAVAEQLAIFTDPAAQRDIARAIIEVKFGNVPDVNAVLAEKVKKFTDAAKSLITSEAHGSLGENHPVTQALREKPLSALP